MRVGIWIVLITLIVVLTIINAAKAQAQEATEASPEAAQPTQASYAATLRLTWYGLSGRTYSGSRVHYGGAACSWNFALGTRFVFPDGEEVVCDDRGRLGWSGWVDVWGRPDIARKYGPYVTVWVVEL